MAIPYTVPAKPMPISSAMNLGNKGVVAAVLDRTIVVTAETRPVMVKNRMGLVFLARLDMAVTRETTNSVLPQCLYGAVSAENRNSEGQPASGERESRGPGATARRKGRDFRTYSCNLKHKSSPAQEHPKEQERDRSLW